MSTASVSNRIAQLKTSDFAVSVSLSPMDVRPGVDGDALIGALTELGHTEFGDRLITEDPSGSVGPPTIAARDISISQGGKVAVLIGWPTMTGAGYPSPLDLHLGSGSFEEPSWLEHISQRGFVPTPTPQTWTWDLDSGRLTAHPIAGAVQSVDVSRDGSFAVATETYAQGPLGEPLLTVLDLHRGGSRKWYLGVGGVEGNMTGQVRLSNDDRWALLGSGPGLIDLENQRLFQLPELRGTFDWDPQCAAGLVGIAMTSEKTASIVRVDLTTGNATKGPDLLRDESKVPWHGEHQRCIGFSVSPDGSQALALTEFGIGPDMKGKLSGCAAGVVDLQSGIVGRTLPVTLDHSVAGFIRSFRNPRWLQRPEQAGLGTIDVRKLQQLETRITDPTDDVYASGAQFLREIDLDLTARWHLQSIVGGHAPSLGMPEPPLRDFLMAYDLLHRTGNAEDMDGLHPQVTGALRQRGEAELARLLEEGISAVRGGGQARINLIERPAAIGTQIAQTPAHDGEQNKQSGDLIEQLEQDAPGASEVLRVALTAVPSLSPERIIRLFAGSYVDGPVADLLDGLPVLLAIRWEPPELILVNDDADMPGQPHVATLPAEEIRGFRVEQGDPNSLAIVTIVARDRSHRFAFHASGYAQYFEAILQSAGITASLDPDPEPGVEAKPPKGTKKGLFGRLRRR